MKKYILRILILLIACVLLAGCATQTTPTEAPSQPSQAPTQTETSPSPTKEEVVIEPTQTTEPTPTTLPETDITIDGDPSDWEGYEDVIFTDLESDTVGGDFDIAAVHAFMNDQYIYVLVESYAPATDYKQIDIVFNTGTREFLTSLLPDMGTPPLGELTTGNYVDIGPQNSFEYAVGDVYEARFPLKVFDNPTDVTLDEIRSMSGECCMPPDWYPVDAVYDLPVVVLDEVEPALDLTLPPSPPVQAQMIAQTQLDLSRYRCDEPADIVTNADRSLAYTVCGNTDTLFVIDTNTDQVIDALPLHEEAEHPFGNTPRLIEITPDDAILLVGNEIDRSLSLIDADSLSVITTLRLDMQPAKIAAAPDGEVAYVVGHDSGKLTVVDIADAKISTQAILPNARGPYSVAFAPDGSAAYVAAMENGMYKIDPTTHQPVDHVDLPNAGWRGDMVVTQDGSTVYLAAVASNWIAEIDTASMTLTRQFDVPMPQSLWLSPDESLMYVGIFSSFTTVQPLQILDLDSGELVDYVELTTPAPEVSWTADLEAIVAVGDGSRLYVPGIDADGIFVVDVATQRQSGFIPLTKYATLQPEHLVINTDGTTLYTLNIAPQAPSISVVEAASGQIETFYYLETDNPCFASTGSRERSPNGTEEASLALMPDDKSLYVSTDTCLLTFDTVSKTFTEATPIEIPAGHAIQDLVISPDGDQIYLIDTGGVLSTLDSQALTVTASVQAVNHGYNVKVAPDNSRVYVTGWEEYAAIDPATSTVLARESINVAGNEQLHAYPDRAIGAPPNNEFYTIGDFFYMQVYNAETNELLRSIDLEPWAPGRTLVTDVIFSPDGKTGYLALWDLKGITVFDTTTWQMVAQVDTGYDPVYGVCPNDFAISPDGSRLYVTGEQSDNIMVIDTATNQVIDVISLAP